ncbi:MAG: CxxxxCH/CxxCH domain-containing protein [Myxococcales bacterium]|nr:CxxxxCH/CxxCH domain-containing protein [Myxococcales bacterium]
MSDRIRSLSLGAVVIAAVAAALAPGCQSQRDDVANQKASACTSCHGDPNRVGTDLERAAPPTDSTGKTDPSSPGVGAHAAHLTATKTHDPVACTECHIVPKQTSDKGHLDDDRPAEFTPGDLAKQGGRDPQYQNFRCSDTYCHRDSDAVWTSPRSSDAACGTCHSLPPPAPHPKSTKCPDCHGAVVDASGIKNPALHVNGTIDVGDLPCDSCHGSDGNPAPPSDLSGNTEVTALGVGAHRVHLAGGAVSRPVPCSECHVVPAEFKAAGHTDSDLPAELTFSGAAIANNRKPTWDRNVRKCSDAWCHSPEAPGPSPEWTTTSGPLPCGGCHGTPPAPPHPQMTNCSRCHGAVINDDNATFKDRTLHVDGVVEVVMPDLCNGCHGSTNPAPPTDLSGSSATTSPGVGAHQAHVVGKGTARKVPCAECHVVPTKVTDPGHYDTLGPAELTFSGVATTGGASPAYSGGSCQNTYCHGAAWPNGKPSGGPSTQPIWTKVDGSQAACGGCHSLPPPAPHPVAFVCAGCHKNIDTSLKFLFPETHVDGLTTFTVP